MDGLVNVIHFSIGSICLVNVIMYLKYKHVARGIHVRDVSNTVNKPKTAHMYYRCSTFNYNCLQTSFSSVIVILFQLQTKSESETHLGV